MGISLNGVVNRDCKKQRAAGKTRRITTKESTIAIPREQTHPFDRKACGVTRALPEVYFKKPAMRREVQDPKLCYHVERFTTVCKRLKP